MALKSLNYAISAGHIQFHINDREINAGVKYNVDNILLDDMLLGKRELDPKDINFKVEDIKDDNTGEGIECTKEMRLLIAKILQDYLTIFCKD
jgi:hypothetical protein